MKQNEKKVQVIHHFFIFQGVNASQTDWLKMPVNKKTVDTTKLKKINNNH